MRKIRTILDTNYKKSDLNKFITKKYQQLSADKHKIILALLNIFEYMFVGTLGKWNNKPVYM